jgi:hypothetical protein
MDMKKILSALDNISERTVQGTNDMKKFVSIIRESSEPVDENIISGFEEGSVGGDANAFLIAADEINDLVMSQIEKIKINADEASLRDMMEKFNAFMTAYHNVGKGILQPDMFNDSLGENYPKQQDLSGISTDKLKAYIAKQSQQQGSGEGNQVKRVRAELQRREQSVAEGSAHGFNVVKWYKKSGGAQLKLTKWLRKEAGLSKDAPVYFDDADLVYGEKTIVPDALINPNLKFNDLLTAVAKAVGDTGKQRVKVQGVYRAQDVTEEKLDKIRDKHDNYNEGLSFLDYLNLAEATGKQKGVDGKACWDGYKRMGTKQKGGKTVDNCVPTGKK